MPHPAHRRIGEHELLRAGRQLEQPPDFRRLLGDVGGDVVTPEEHDAG
jgi:hypothetical protein